MKSQTLEEAGISERAREFIRQSGFENQIVNDERLQYCLNGIIFSEPVPTGATMITTVNQLINLSPGTINSPKTYFADGEFILNANQTIDIPSHINLYVRGRIFKLGAHTTVTPGGDKGPENNVEHIFYFKNSRNVRVVGIDNALVESNPEGDEYNRATGFYLEGSNNVEIRGFHIKNVWEGVNCRWQVDRVLIRNNYIQNTNKRAIWLLGANETTAAHNFLENCGWDGIDWDAFAGSRSADTSGTLDKSSDAIGAPVDMPSGNLGNIGFENFVLGAGRFMGFVEEGARDTFIVNNIGFMANYFPANPMRLSFQLGWVDNASSEAYFNEVGTRTEDNAFISNVIYRPEEYNREQRAGRVVGGGDFSATDRGAVPFRKGLTYFYANEGYGKLLNGDPIGKSRNPTFLIRAVCSDEIPTSFESFDNRYASFNPQTRIQALKDAYRIGTTRVIVPDVFPVNTCDVTPPDFELVSITDTSATLSFENAAEDTRRFELRSYLPGMLNPNNVNINAIGYASANAGQNMITINGLEPNTTYDLAMRALCGDGQAPSRPNAPITVTTIPTLGVAEFEQQILDKINIYPIPVEDILNIRSELNFTRIQVFDIYGRKQVSIVNKDQVNLQFLGSGVYFVKFEESVSGISVTKKISKR